MNNKKTNEMLQNILDEVAEKREQINDLLADIQIRIENEMLPYDCEDCEDTGEQTVGEHDNKEVIKCHCQIDTGSDE